MEAHKQLCIYISALVDGELPERERELALAALSTAEGQAAWRAYHLAGDALRAGAAGAVSDTFSARLAARLAAEPAHQPEPPAPPEQPAAADTLLP